MKVDRHLSSYKSWGVWKADTHLILHKSLGGLTHSQLTV